MKKNNTIDIAAWILVAVILVAIPLIVTSFFTAPELGPPHNPSVMVMFIALVAFIALTTIGLWGQVFTGRTKSIADRTALSVGTLNIVTLHDKLLGGLFLLSGFVKLQDPLGFAYKLDDYWYAFEKVFGVFPAELFTEFSLPMAMGISVFEITLALALMTGFKMRQTSLIAVLMLIFFTFLTGFVVVTGEVTDCGCFGDALKLTPVQTFTKDILLTLAAIPIFLMRKRIKPLYRTPVPIVLIVVATLGTGYISYHSLNHLPVFDFRGAYLEGQNLTYNSTTYNEEDQLIAHDFYDFCADCGKGNSGLEGASLYIVCYGMDKHSIEPYQEAVQLARQLAQEAPGISVCSASDVPGSVRKTLLPVEDMDALCMSSQDSKMLKTMIRSSPGYLLLQDGVIQKKWHHNDMPSVSELVEMVGPKAKERPYVPVFEPPVMDSTGTDSSVTNEVDAPQ